MALITLNFPSYKLMKQTEICVCVPDPKGCETPISEFTVLWLLHGLSDDNTCWLRYSNIERYANESQMIVVMPNGDRSMYMDNVIGQNYKSMITDELPLYLHRLLGISNERSKNYIAGLSMGGMGAAKIALSNPDKYAGFGSFSGVLDISLFKNDFPELLERDFPFMKELFEMPDLGKEDPKSLLDGNLHRNLKMYVSCGTEDYWMRASQAFKENADKLGLDVKYVFEEGNHEWRLWDLNVRRFIDFIKE